MIRELKSENCDGRTGDGQALPNAASKPHLTLSTQRTDKGPCSKRTYHILTGINYLKFPRGDPDTDLYIKIKWKPLPLAPEISIIYRLLIKNTNHIKYTIKELSLNIKDVTVSILDVYKSK